MNRSLINEDSNQFGPGTDLIICLFALLMVFVVIVSYFYSKEKEKVEKAKAEIEQINNKYEKTQTKLNQEKGGKFKLAGRFLAGTFKLKPYVDLSNQQATENKVLDIVENYRKSSSDFPYIFVIGHANEIGIEGRPDMSEEELLKRNWGIAGERSAVIANLIQKKLYKSERNNIVIVSTGEFDLKNIKRPNSLENAYVEVLFGKDWKNQLNNESLTKP